jgi:hypothetical protein
MESRAALLQMGGFYEEEAQKGSIRLRFRILDDWENSIVLSSGGSVGQFPLNINLYTGEPILGNKQRVQGGGGLLTYIPARTSIDSPDTTACIDGWVAIGEVAFDRLWRLLSSNSCHVIRAEMCRASGVPNAGGLDLGC